MKTSPKDLYSGANDCVQLDKNNLIRSLSDWEKIKPFISLKIVNAQTGSRASPPELIPASGKAIIIYVVAGEVAYSDSTGKQGILKKDDWCWIVTGSGVWYSIKPLTSNYVGVQVDIALSPALENSPPQSACVNTTLTTTEDPVQVLLGWHDKSRSTFAVPSQVNYFVVHLKAKQRWRYELPLNHQFAWVGVVEGRLKTNAGELHPNSVTAFNRTDGNIEFHAQADSVLVLGSAMEFGYDLLFQQNSVHTSTEALQLGMKGIAATRTALAI